MGETELVLFHTQNVCSFLGFDVISDLKKKKKESLLKSLGSCLADEKSFCLSHSGASLFAILLL